MELTSCTHPPLFNEVYYILVQCKKKKKSPRRGIEPRSGTRQAPILTIKLSRINYIEIIQCAS